MSFSKAELLNVVTSGDRDALAALIAGGVDVNTTNDGGQTPLILAIISGQDLLLPLLLRAGADPFLRDHTGLDAVDWAERKGRTDLVKLLARNKQSHSTAATPSKTQVRSRPGPSAEPPGDRPTSAEERTRKYLAGLRQRFAENPHPYPRTTQGAHEQSDRSQIEAKDDSLGVQSDAAIPVRTKASSDAPTEEPVPALTPPQDILHRSSRQKIETTDDRVSTRYEGAKPVTAAASSLSQSQEPLATLAPRREVRRPSSSRKRCPQCNTIYDNELLAYCAYHIVPLVDADVPVVPSTEPKASSFVVWTLVLFTLVAAVFASLFVSNLLFRNDPDATPKAPATQPASSLKGIPVARGALAEKAVSLPAAEVPMKSVQQPTTVNVRVKIDRTGRVVEASSTSNNRLLREAAITAASKATFSIQKLGGRGTDGTITYTFNP